MKYEEIYRQWSQAEATENRLIRSLQRWYAAGDKSRIQFVPYRLEGGETEYSMSVCRVRDDGPWVSPAMGNYTIAELEVMLEILRSWEAYKQGGPEMRPSDTDRP